MKTNWILIATVLIIIIIGGVYFLLPRMGNTATYESSTYNFSFEYPSDFEITERNLDINGEGLLVLTLLPRDSSVAENGEGPAAVSVIVTVNPTTTPLREVIERLQFTGDGGQLTDTTLAGLPAVSYRTTGLYEADNVALSHNSRIYIISAAWISRDDPNLAAFKTIMETFEVR
jgi:hypothetical protein